MSKHNGHLFVPPWLVDLTVAGVSVFGLTASQDGTPKGMAHVLTRGALSNIFLLSEQILGTTTYEFRPGWWPLAVPDASSGMSTFDVGNVRRRMVGGAGYMEWTVPATGVPASMDTIQLYTEQDGAETIDVVRYRGGSPTTIVSATTPSSVAAYPTVVTLLADVQPGDTVRIKSSSASTIRLWGFALFDSTGDPDPAMHFVPVNWDLPGGVYHGTDDSVAEPTGSYSSTECAYAFGPTGSTPKFVGGPTHNDGTVYCAEVNCVESRSDDSGSFALAQGYHLGDGPVVLARSADVRYTDGSTILGTLDTEYRLRAYEFEVAGPFVSSVALDLSSLYPMMGHFGFGTVTADDGDSAAANAAHTYDDAVRMVRAASRDGQGYYQHLSDSEAIDLVDKNTGGKCYWRDSRQGSTNVPAPMTISRRWQGFVDDGAGKTKPTLAVVIGADGVTATITGTTKSPRMLGTTGVTIKKGGVAVTIDSKVNNGDDTITYVINAADIVLPSDTMTFDYAPGSIADNYGVAPADVTGGSVTNNSEADAPDISYPGSPFEVQVGEAVSEDVTDAGAPHDDPPVFAIDSGSLPPGLALDADTGTISGTVSS